MEIMFLTLVHKKIMKINVANNIITKKIFLKEFGVNFRNNRQSLETTIKCSKINFKIYNNNIILKMPSKNQMRIIVSQDKYNCQLIN